MELPRRGDIDLTNDTRSSMEKDLDALTRVVGATIWHARADGTTGMEGIVILETHFQRRTSSKDSVTMVGANETQ